MDKNKEDAIKFLIANPDSQSTTEPTAKGLWFEKYNTLSQQERERFNNAVKTIPLADIDNIVLETLDPDRRLWNDVMLAWRWHSHFEKEWHYVMSALGVFEAVIARRLPLVWYLCFEGDMGANKTGNLILHQTLTQGLVFGNVSITSLARAREEIDKDADKNPTPMYVDEVDVSRGKDYNETRDSLFRQGYMRDCPPYTRYSIEKKGNVFIPQYGFKCFTYRTYIDSALRNRAYCINCSAFNGSKEEGYLYVAKNMYKLSEADMQGLPARIQAWGEKILATYDDESIKKMIFDPEMIKDVISVREEMVGANRSTQLLIIAMVVAKLIGVNLKEEMKLVVNDNMDTDDVDSDVVEDLQMLILSKAGTMQSKILAKGVPDVVLKQRPFVEELNAQRRAKNVKPLNAVEFKNLRRKAGVKDTMITTPHNKITWRLPAEFIASISLQNELKEDSQTDANISNISNPESLLDWQDEKVSNVSNVSKGLGEEDCPKSDKKVMKNED